jgi:hypothetical protein
MHVLNFFFFFFKKKTFLLLQSPAQRTGGQGSCSSIYENEKENKERRPNFFSLDFFESLEHKRMDQLNAATLEIDWTH